MFEKFKMKQEENYTDSITQLTTFEQYVKADDSVYPGKYPMMPYNDAINYLFTPLGFNLEINDFQKKTNSYQQRALGAIQQLEHPISTIKIYDKSDHYDLEQNPSEDVLMDDNPYQSIHSCLSDAIGNSEAVLNNEGKFDDINFTLITTYVEQKLSELKQVTKQELHRFLMPSPQVEPFHPASSSSASQFSIFNPAVEEVDSVFNGLFDEDELESDIPALSAAAASLNIKIKQLGYSDAQVAELENFFHTCMQLVSDTLALNLHTNVTVTEADYIDKSKEEIIKLDENYAKQLQAEEIEQFKLSR